MEEYVPEQAFALPFEVIMRIELQGNIRNVVRNDDGTVTLTLKLNGNVANRTGEAKKASLDGTLTIKQVVADELKIGSIVSIDVVAGIVPRNVE